MAATLRTGGVKALLIDITGVLYDGEKPFPGSIEALKRVQDSSLKYILCTNETHYTRQTMAQRLSRIGLEVPMDKVHSPAPACARYLREHQLRPHFVAHPDILAEFERLDCSDPNAVVLGDAAEAFSYKSLNDAFRLLESKKDCILIALGMGRYYKEKGCLFLDVGPYAKALEFATGKAAVTIGKPSADYFKAALTQLGVSPEEAVMIGDDVVSDVGGAISCGMQGVLVRTGKFRPSDEHHPSVKPSLIADDFHSAIQAIL